MTKIKNSIFIILDNGMKLYIETMFFDRSMTSAIATTQFIYKEKTIDILYYFDNKRLIAIYWSHCSLPAKALNLDER